MAEGDNIDKTTKAAAENAETLAEDLAKSGERIKEISKEATSATNSFKQMAANMRESAKSGGDFSNAIKYGGDLSMKLSRSSAAIARFTKDNLKSSVDTKKVLQQHKALKGQIQEIDSQIKYLQDAKANATKEERIQINKTLETLLATTETAQDLVKHIEEVAAANDKLNDSTAWMDGMAAVVGDIPVIGKMFGEFSKAAKQAREDGVEGGDASAPETVTGQELGAPATGTEQTI
jgi:methyl-accepting chemotaxis protein